MNTNDIKNIKEINFEKMKTTITIKYNDEKEEKIDLSLNCKEDLIKIESLLEFLNTYNLKEKCDINN